VTVSILTEHELILVQKKYDRMC